MDRVINLWDRKIPATIIRNPTRIRGGFPGVYVWYFNQHLTDTVLYVGKSANVWERLYDEYRCPSGFISKWIEAKVSERTVYCDKYSDPIIDGPILKPGRCDCIPRLKVKIITRDEIWIDELEKSLIEQLNPLLNKTRYKNVTLDDSAIIGLHQSSGSPYSTT